VEQGRKLTRGLDEFDRQSLREGAAALMLWPKNADRHAALQELVDALVAEPKEGGGRPIEAADWEVWLASEEAKALQEIHPDGIHDAPLAIEAALLGRKRALIAGHLEFPSLQYRLWMEALAGVHDPDLEAALDLLRATSEICHAVVEESGISGCKWPDHPGPGAPVAAPPQEEYERLRSALRIEAGQEAMHLLEPLMHDADSGRWQPLRMREDASSFLVVDPWRLTLAGLVHAVDRAACSTRFAEITGRLERALVEMAAIAAEEMDWTVERVEKDHLVVRADVDCLVVIGTGVIPPDPEQLQEEMLSVGGYLYTRCEQIAARARSLNARHALLVLIGDGRGIILDRNHPCLRAERKSDPWLVGAGELQVMGEALRGDPLVLPAALEMIPPPHAWPENHDLLDAVGAVRQGEERDPLKPDFSDATEYMLQLARLKAMRHPAILPDLSRWVEVSRWEGAGNALMFRSRDSDEFALLVRASGRFLWVTCDATFEERWDLLPVIATALAFWLNGLCKAGLLLSYSLSGQVIVQFRFELDERSGPQLALGPAEKTVRVIIGPGFVDSFCRGDNEADRMLAGAILAWARRTGDPVPETALDEVLPPGYGTFAVWPDPTVSSNPPRLESLPPVERRAKLEIETSLAAAVVEPTEVVVARDEGLEPVLERLISALEGGIQAKIDSLEPAALRALIELHERAVFQGASEAILLPSLSVWRSAEGQPVLIEEEAHRDLVLRVLIERASARPPSGMEQLGRRCASRLRAATELQLQLRSALDTVRYAEADGHAVISPHLGIQLDLGGDLPGASHARFEQIAASAPDLMALEHDEWWGGEPVLTPTPALDVPLEPEGNWKELDLAMHEEWGVGLEQMMRVLRALSELAGKEADCVASAPPASLARSLVGITSIRDEEAVAAIERLTLGPCADFDASDERHQPGWANRERSYLRRPLVALPDGELAWSSLHCLRAAEYLAGLIQSDRLRGPKRLSKLVTWISQELDEAFEDAVLEEVRRCGWRGQARVTQLAGKQLRRRRGEGIGDVDVLAWSEERREVWLLDAKRLSPGFAPGPMVREAESFEEHVGKHEERLRWVLEHLPELATELGVESVSGWEVRAALVLDRPLAGAHLRQLSMPIWTHWSLKHELGPAQVGSGRSAEL
jgi:hypothetical protein